MTLVIRRATIDDVPVLLRLIRRLAEEEGAAGQVTAGEAELRRDGFGPRPRFEALLAERAGVAVGLALYQETYRAWEGTPGLFLEDLYVVPGERRAGTGRALMTRVAAECRERGGTRVDLVALAWNPARRFYDRLGLAEIPEWRAYRLAGRALARLVRRHGGGGTGGGGTG